MAVFEPSRPGLIDRLVRILHSLGFEPTSLDLADLIWLAGYLDAPPEQPEDRSEDELQQLPNYAIDQPFIKQNGLENPSPVTLETPIPSRRAGLFSFEHDGLNLTTPGGPALPGKLGIGRALRLIMQRKPSSSNLELDEDTTVQQIADEDNWTPVLRPALTQWLELDLVIDEWPSMVIWKHAIRELCQLLEQQGAFQNVRIWNLETTEPDHNVRLYTGIRSIQRLSRSPKELLDVRGNRLILVVSDCLSPAWYEGQMGSLFTEWGKHQMVALVQVLPERLWPRTGLGNANPIWLKSRLPGTPNSRLQMRLAMAGADDIVQRAFPIPVTTLEPEYLKAWSGMVAGRNRLWIPGFLIPLDNTTEQQRLSEYRLQLNQKPEDPLEIFKSLASPQAYQLATHLAAVPLSLPIMHLVQRVLLPESRQVHLAEFFLSGLIRRKEIGETLGNITVNDSVRYDFLPGVRERLLVQTPVSSTLEVLRSVSRFVDRHTGQPIDFRAIVANPHLLGEAGFGKDGELFATITSQVLRQLGRQYVSLADQIDLCLGANPNSSPLYENFVALNDLPLANKSEGYYFISYSSSDASEFVSKLIKILESGNPALKVRVGRDLKPGADWDEQLTEVISGCDCLIYVLTHDSVDKRSLCKHEWMYALKYKKPIIPLLIQAGVKMPVQLEPRQIFDFTSTPEPTDLNLALTKLRDYIYNLKTPSSILQSLQASLNDALRNLQQATDPTNQTLLQSDIDKLQAQIELQQQLVYDVDEKPLHSKETDALGLRNKMTFLDAAEHVLKEFGGVLSASEIIHQIVKQGLIPINGRTPVQTMYARLSVDIKKNGENSRFKRTDKGKYTLRSNPSKEYLGIPHQRVITDTEMVLAFPSKLLNDLGYFHGIRKDFKIYEDILLNPDTSFFMRRLEVEKNPTYKQIVSYIIIRYQDMLLRYTRGVGTNDDRYQPGEHSLGFGGHVQRTDWDLFSSNDMGYKNSILRELREELSIDQSDIRLDNLSTIGILNEGSSFPARCHFAFLHLLKLDNPAFIKGEQSINKIKWIPIAGLGGEFSGYEYWSKLCIQTYFNDNSIIPCYIYKERNFQLRDHSETLLVVGYIGSGKTEACYLLEKEYSYIRVPCSIIMQKIIGCPPIGEIGLKNFQDYCVKFFEDQSGHERLAQGIIDYIEKYPNKKFVFDGLQFPETLYLLQKKISKHIPVIYIESSIDNLYDRYVRRDVKGITFDEFLKIINHPVEREIEKFRLEANITVYNQNSPESYITELSNFFKNELGY